MKANKNLLVRLVVSGRFQNITLQELLTYSLGPLPLVNTQGFLVKTNKAILFHALVNYSGKLMIQTPILGGVSIVDGMPLI